MKCFALILLVPCLAVKVSPIEKTVQLLSDLQAKIVKDGENEQKLYEEFTAFCNDGSKNTQFAIKTSKADGERAGATVAQESAKIDSAESKIEELSTQISTDGKDLSSASKIRANEKADFQNLDADLGQTVDMLGRAVSIIEREMKGSSFVQSDSVQKVADALNTLVNAAGVNSNDKAKIEALLQSQTASEDTDLALQPGGAPDPSAYESQSGGILDTLEDMLEKSQGQRADAQKSEMNAEFDFNLLKQKLEDAMATGDKIMGETKKAKAAAEEAKAVANGELDTANAGTKDDSKRLADLQSECMSKASAFEESQHERSNELTALSTAKQVLEEKTGGAADRSYSFIQLKTRVRAHVNERTSDITDVLALVQGLAKTNDSKSLAQLASRMETASAMGVDPFGKVKGMIQEMIEQLVAEAQKEASHKAFCDKEMSETKAKRDDKQDEVDDLDTKIDKATTKIAKLKEDVATLESELADIAKAQAEATKVRMEEKEAFKTAKADFESGLEGVGMALQVLRDYYAKDDESFIQSTHAKSDGAASGIIGMLEVIESDFSKMLASGTATENQAQELYEKNTQDNEVATAEKTTAVKYKNKDSKETEAALSGNREDRQTSQSELDAIVEYWDKLQPMCVAKAEPYAERKRRREAEVAGLKQALEILEEEAGSPAFLQIRRA